MVDGECAFRQLQNGWRFGSKNRSLAAQATAVRDSESSFQSTRCRKYVCTDTTLIAMYAFVVLSLPQCRSLPSPRDCFSPPDPSAAPRCHPLLPLFSSRAILDSRPLSLPHKRFCATLRPEVKCNASDHPHAEPRDWMQKPVTEVQLGRARSRVE